MEVEERRHANRGRLKHGNPTGDFTQAPLQRLPSTVYFCSRMRLNRGACPRTEIESRTNFSASSVSLRSN
jgi:hypothetical protein